MPVFKKMRSLQDVPPPVPYAVVLKQIADCLQQKQQWLDMDDPARGFEYHSAAEALVALLEVHNCGSIGGFDIVGKGMDRRDQQAENDGKLQSRFEWLRDVRGAALKRKKSR